MSCQTPWVCVTSESTERPVTYTFVAELVGALGGRVLEARITAAHETAAFANVVFEGPNGKQVVDARASASLNLALRTVSPVSGISNPSDPSGLVRQGMGLRVLEDHGQGWQILVAEDTDSSSVSS